MVLLTNVRCVAMAAVLAWSAAAQQLSEGQQLSAQGRYSEAREVFTAVLRDAVESLGEEGWLAPRRATTTIGARPQRSPEAASEEDAPVDDWAAEFDAWVAEQVEKRDIGKLYEYRRSAPHGRLSAPTTEHFDPLFVVMGASWPGDGLETIFAGFHHGNLSMRSFSLG